MIIGLIEYWPGRPAAEHETIMRLKRAAELTGHEIVVLGPDGHKIHDADKNVDFVINLHFASGKSTDDLTYGALWNPLDFYEGWGIEQTYANQISNDFLISCGAHKIDKYFTGNKIPPVIESILSHSVPEIFQKPIERKDRRLFYIGINWERSTKRHGRHHELLQLLDKSGQIDIYGPKRLGPDKPWSGFTGYKSELPFDGHSVYEALSKSGIGLVLSSISHKQDKIMTSRLFESVASGAAIIGDSHEFLQENFSGLVWQFNDSQNIHDQASQILEFVQEINSYPSKTLLKINSTQEIILREFNLATQLNSICLHASSVIESMHETTKPNAAAIVINPVFGKEQIENLNKIRAAGFQKIVIFTNQNEQILGIQDVEFRHLSSGASVDDCLEEYLKIDSGSEFLACFSLGETIFHDYLEAAKGLEEDKVGVFVSCSRINTENEKRADTINPLTSAWHGLYLPSLIFRSSSLKTFFDSTGQTCLLPFLAKYYRELQIDNDLSLDPKARFRVYASAPTIGAMQGHSFNRLYSKLQNSQDTAISPNWIVALYKLARTERNNTVLELNGLSIIRMLYRQFNWNPKVDRVLKRIFLGILKN